MDAATTLMDIQVTVMITDPDYAEWYATDSLNYALSTYLNTGTLEQWDEALNEQPVANYITHDEWHVKSDKPMTVYWGEGEDEDEVHLTAIIGIVDSETHMPVKGTDMLFHSCEIPSMFFRIVGDGQVTALYVD